MPNETNLSEQTLPGTDVQEPDELSEEDRQKKKSERQNHGVIGEKAKAFSEHVCKEFHQRG